MKNLFTKHPNSVGETYWQHLKIALKGTVRLGISAIIFLVHAIFPFIPVPKPYDLVSLSDWLNDIRKSREVAP